MKCCHLVALCLQARPMRKTWLTTHIYGQSKSPKWEGKNEFCSFDFYTSTSFDSISTSVVYDYDFSALAYHIVLLEVSYHMKNQSLQQLQFGNKQRSIMLLTFDFYRIKKTNCSVHVNNIRWNSHHLRLMYIYFFVLIRLPLNYLVVLTVFNPSEMWCFFWFVCYSFVNGVMSFIVYLKPLFQKDKLKLKSEHWWMCPVTLMITENIDYLLCTWNI